ncbi:MAG: MOSC domain-containing protein [Deltaproteobacteria bacterium]|nr:MOSC domain-containing protein [Candidatus Zymogenaceae bacterium]
MTRTGTILSINVSETTGVVKKPVSEVELKEQWGIVGDGHAGLTDSPKYAHRQVSMLAQESIDTVIENGYDVSAGSFAENITTKGLDLVSLPVGTIITTKDGIVLEVSQIGKECHAPCAIFRAVGDCVMPREGIFVRVLKGGVLRVGDVLTVSASSGEFAQ